MYETAAEFVFKDGSNGGSCLVAGWGPLEAGNVWSASKEARLRLPVAPGDGDLMLQLLIVTYTLVPFHTMQRVGVEVNGIDCGMAETFGEAALGFHLARDRFGAPDTLDIRLSLPDAIRPADANISDDRRELGIALIEALAIRVPPEPSFEPQILPPLPIDTFPGERATAVLRGFTALAPAQLAEQFESLGYNCDFGFLQSALGAEPLGLLRFGSTSMHRLLRGLDLGFPGIENEDRLRIWYERGVDDEYRAHHLDWLLQTHTRRQVGEIEPDRLRRDQARRLGFLRRMLFENLDSSRKLFVYQHFEPLAEAHILPLLTTLRSFGRNALLFIARDDGRPPGTVERLRTGLYFGSMDGANRPGNRYTINVPSWISVCANAYRLWRLDGGGA